LGFIGVEVVAVLLSSDPVVEGGVWDAGLASKLASGGVGLLGVAEIVEGLCGVAAAPAEGVWLGVSVGVKLRGSHGLCLWGSCGKDTVGRQARLVQRRETQKEDIGTGGQY
jgi:hypothetical protein